MVLVFVSKNAVAINLAIKNRVNPDFLDVVARSNQIETLNLLIYMTYIGAKKNTNSGTNANHNKMTFEYLWIFQNCAMLTCIGSFDVKQNAYGTNLPEFEYQTSTFKTSRKRLIWNLKTADLMSNRFTVCHVSAGKLHLRQLSRSPWTFHQTRGDSMGSGAGWLCCLCLNKM